MPRIYVKNILNIDSFILKSIVMCVGTSDTNLSRVRVFVTSN
jgi:hypothetical protein